MQVKCLHPIVLLNPEARKRALEFTHLYIKGKNVCHIMELVLLDFYKYTPKHYNVSVDDVDSCYLYNYKTGEVLPFYIVSPCGKCLLCRKRKANALAARAVAETNTCGVPPLFITFTYNNFNLPKTDLGHQTLQKVDFQLFMKRLRSLLDGECIEHNLRYLACGEYGHKTKRPHYHVLLWNFPCGCFANMLDVQAFIQKAWSRYQVDICNRRIPMLKQCTVCPYHQYKFADKCSSCADHCSGQRIYNKNGSLVYRRLPLGSIKILPSNAGAPAYITKYLVKGSNAPFIDCEPPFRCASNRNGGIGSAFVRSMRKEILDNPTLQAIPIVDQVTGSAKTFYLPVDSWVKNTLIPSPSQYLKKSQYETVREFVNIYQLFNHAVQQLYRLWPMDKYVDGELVYYKDKFCDPSTRSLWRDAYMHCSPYVCPDIEGINYGNWIKSRELFNDYIYTLTTRLDNLARKCLEINIPVSYFCQRDKYLKDRLYGFKRLFKDSKELNLQALSENIASSIERNRWREYF